MSLTCACCFLAFSPDLSPLTLPPFSPSSPIPPSIRAPVPLCDAPTPYLLSLPMMCRHSKGGNVVTGEYVDLTTGDQVLVNDSRWARSQFGVLERFMRDFLAGGAGGSESMRLKLQTPLYVAAALLDAARKQLEADLALAQQVRGSIPRTMLHLLFEKSS